MTVTIALDAMGGDRGADMVVPAAVNAVKHHPDLRLILVGDESLLKKKLRRRYKHNDGRIKIHHASEVVAMDEPPAKALRYKKDSSMRVAINLVHEGEADACVSAGNTGALMATARFVLKTLPGIDRPAIVGIIPSQNDHGFVRMLDLGANVGATAEQLFQFAVMGSILAEEANDTDSPRVALLNIGEEEIKGHEEIRDASQMLKETSLNYIGFVEGDDIFLNKADVIIADGFVGNISLKTTEGLARYVRNMMQDAFQRTLWGKFAALFAWPVLMSLKKRLNPAAHNGASFLGLKGIVIKSHGGTTVAGFEKAIEKAVLEVEHNVPEKISQQVEKLLAAFHREEVN